MMTPEEIEHAVAMTDKLRPHVLRMEDALTVAQPPLSLNRAKAVARLALMTLWRQEGGV